MQSKGTPERHIKIPKEAHGKNLVEYLSNRFTYFNASQWQNEIACERVLINNEKCSLDYILNDTDSLMWKPEPYEEPEVPMEFAILFEDDEFLFIDKPAGLPCHPGGRFLFHTLWALLRKNYSHISFINRLDRETSGIVLVAKNTESAGRANLHMSKHRIIKEYLVLVDGLFPERLQAYGYLEKDTTSQLRKKLRFIPATEKQDERAERTNPLSCQTDFTLVQHVAEVNGQKRNCSLVHAQLYTGRTHQIRASLCSLGWPVIGDKIYGQDDGLFLKYIEGKLSPADMEVLALPNQALHCTRMCLPRSPTACTDITSTYPDSWLLRAAIDRVII